jgi:hypothetical protein
MGRFLGLALWLISGAMIILILMTLWSSLQDSIFYIIHLLEVIGVKM